MKREFRSVVENLAKSAHIHRVADSFYQKLQWYMDKPELKSKSSRERALIEAYLCSGAIRIAKADGKSQLEGDDLKASIWYFHVPVDENDKCSRAAEKILEFESRRIEIKPLPERYLSRASKDYELEPELRQWAGGQESKWSSGEQSGGTTGFMTR